MGNNVIFSGRSVSPTRMASPQQPRPTSPFKPHPLQFVSPQKAQQGAPPPPPKPARTYINMEEEQDSPPPINRAKESFKSEAVLEIPEETAPETPNERTDSASRRSILEKRTLFEGPSPPEGNSPDPAMLPLSQRKALFEKNKSIPKPIARFGESVTPAMLSKASKAQVPASEPAWKRRRDASPDRKQQATFYTPKISSNRGGNAAETPSAAITSGMRTEPPKKVLFEHQNWARNDIAKAQDDAKKKDLEILMNRFKKVSDDVEEMRRSPSPQKARTPSPVKEPEPLISSHENYPGVHSLKRIKVSPPRLGNLYPDLTDIHDERPETAMSMETNSVTSEAPSLGTAIQKLASGEKRKSPMKAIVEDLVTEEEDEAMDDIDDEINDMLDEALDDSQVTMESGPTPPKVSRRSPSTTSAGSWEFNTPAAPSQPRDFKTPRVDAIRDSPQAQLPQVEGSSPQLMHTVSFYR